MDHRSFELSANTSTLTQAGVTYLVFSMTATALARLACPRRFSEDPQSGVQRDLDEKQVKAFMAAMREGKAIPSNVVLNLTGEWITDATSIFGVQGTSFVEALDGQHRGEAARRLVKNGAREITDGYHFVVMAVQNASDQLRRELFLAQIKSLRISGEHAASVRHQAGEFVTVTEREAHMIARALHDREDSPLRGRVHFGDKVLGFRGKKTISEGTWLSLTSLVTSTRMLASGGSVVKDLPIEGKIQFAIDMLSAADEVYPTQFAEGGSLRTPFGIATLCQLTARKDGTFRASLQQRGTSKHEILQLFKLVPRFQWAVREGRINRHIVPGLVVERFNERLFAALNRQE